MALCHITGQVFLQDGRLAKDYFLTLIATTGVAPGLAGTLLPNPVKIRTDKNGDVDFYLASGNYIGYYFVGQTKLSFQFNVPAQDDADFADCLIYGDYNNSWPYWLEQVWEARDEAQAAEGAAEAAADRAELFGPEMYRDWSALAASSVSWPVTTRLNSRTIGAVDVVSSGADWTHPVTGQGMQAVLDTQTTPEAFGGNGNGVANNSAAFARAKVRGAALTLYPGKTYRISSNTTAGLLINLGGIVSIDSGVVLTIDGVVGADSKVCFSGAGTVRTSDRHYSVGWFGDNDLSDAWDFCRRGFLKDALQTCIWPNKADGTSWQHSRPLEFDDPENRTVFNITCSIVASETMNAQFIFSPINKTEDMNFIGKIDLDGDSLADHAVLMRGGARIRFENIITTNDHLSDAFLVDPQFFTVDELFINMLSAVRHGGYALNLYADAGHILAPQVNMVFSNGCRVDAGDGVLNMEGHITAPDIRYVLENAIAQPSIDIGAFGPDVSLVRIAAGDHYFNNTWQSPRGVHIGKIWGHGHTKQLLKVEKGGVQSTSRVSFAIDHVDRFRSTEPPSPLASVDHVRNSTITLGHNTVAQAVAITVGENVDGLSIKDVDPVRVAVPSGSYDRMLINGSQGIDTNIADDAVVMIRPRNTNGILNVHCGQENNGWAIIAWRGDGFAVVVQKGSDVDVVTTPLTGTTGADGKFTIGVSGNRIYLENRLGSSKRVSAVM